MFYSLNILLLVFFKWKQYFTTELVHYDFNMIEWTIYFLISSCAISIKWHTMPKFALPFYETLKKGCYLRILSKDVKEEYYFRCFRKPLSHTIFTFLNSRGFSNLIIIIFRFTVITGLMTMSHSSSGSCIRCWCCFSFLQWCVSGFLVGTFFCLSKNYIFRK